MQGSGTVYATRRLSTFIPPCHAQPHGHLICTVHSFYCLTLSPKKEDGVYCVREEKEKHHPCAPAARRERENLPPSPALVT